MPEGHTLHRLAGALHHAFAGQRVLATSPQGRFEDGAAQLNGRVIEHQDQVEDARGRRQTRVVLTLCDALSNVTTLRPRGTS